MKKGFLAAALALASAGGCYVGVYAPPVAVGVSAPIRIRWEVVPGTPIYYTEYGGGTVFFYNNRYYRVVNGVWYVAPYWGGGWRVVASVPEVFLWIPPSHPLHWVVRYHPLYRYRVRRYQRPVVSQPVPAPAGHRRPVKGKKGKQEGGPAPASGGTWIRR